MKKVFAFVGIIVVCLSCFVLGGTITIPHAEDNLSTDSMKLESADTERSTKKSCSIEELEGRKIFIFNGLCGIAMTENQVSQLVKQAKDTFHSGSTLVVLAETGKEIYDEKTGITFVTRSNVNVELLNGADIFILNHSSFNKLLNDWPRAENSNAVKQITIAENTYNLYG